MGRHYRCLTGRASFRHALLSTTILGGLAGLPASPALAACTPAAGPGTPASGTTVICESVIVNQNSSNGYGDGTQVGLKINQNGNIFSSGAFAPGVEGAALRLATGNTVTNHGIIEGNGERSGVPAGYGIVGSNLTVTNLKGFFIRGNVSAISENTNLSPTNPAGTTTVLNEGGIQGGASFGVQGTTLKLDNIGSAFIRGSAAVHGSTVDIFNSGTIEGTGVGVSASRGTINNVGGRITGAPAADAGIAHVGMNDTLTINNDGQITDPGGGNAIRNFTTSARHRIRQHGQHQQQCQWTHHDDDRQHDPVHVVDQLSGDRPASRRHVEYQQCGTDFSRRQRRRRDRQQRAGLSHERREHRDDQRRHRHLDADVPRRQPERCDDPPRRRHRFQCRA